MALPIIAAGVLARVGAKKLAKKLVTRVGKKERKKLTKQKKDDQVRLIRKVDGKRLASADKISAKKLYRGTRERDGSYTDPGNKIQREVFGVKIGSKPIGKNPNKVKQTRNKSPMSSLTGKVQKQQANRPYSTKNPTYKNPTKRINSKDMTRAFKNARKNNLFKIPPKK